MNKVRTYKNLTIVFFYLKIIYKYKYKYKYFFNLVNTFPLYSIGFYSAIII